VQSKTGPVIGMVRGDQKNEEDQKAAESSLVEQRRKSKPRREGRKTGETKSISLRKRRNGRSIRSLRRGAVEKRQLKSKLSIILTEMVEDGQIRADRDR